jgi:hypothetical protein
MEVLERRMRSRSQLGKRPARERRMAAFLTSLVLLAKKVALKFRAGKRKEVVIETVMYPRLFLCFLFEENGKEPRTGDDVWQLS